MYTTDLLGFRYPILFPSLPKMMSLNGKEMQPYFFTKDNHIIC